MYTSDEHDKKGLKNIEVNRKTNAKFEILFQGEGITMMYLSDYNWDLSKYKLLEETVNVPKDC
jgi:hypothetical protein